MPLFYPKKIIINNSFLNILISVLMWLLVSPAFRLNEEEFSALSTCTMRNIGVIVIAIIPKNILKRMLVFCSYNDTVAVVISLATGTEYSTSVILHIIYYDYYTHSRDKKIKFKNQRWGQLLYSWSVNDS